MTIQQAIEKAIEGGWKPEHKELEHWRLLMPKLHKIDHERIVARAFLDPLFWQSLGKAMGWKEITCRNEQPNSPECRCDGGGVAGWFYNWHRFIDHLAEGKDAESFFENLS